jgi:hypothetical protein
MTLFVHVIDVRETQNESGVTSEYPKALLFSFPSLLLQHDKVAVTVAQVLFKRVPEMRKLLFVLFS